MLAWCTILFILGILAFLDTIFNYGEIFRKVNSVVFMLVSLGLLVRTSMKMRLKKTEAMIARIEELEEHIAKISGPSAPSPSEKEREKAY
jgi:cytochrome c oxidase subunit IV